MWRKATDAEVIEALTKECVKRYGEDWKNVKIKAYAFKPISCEINLKNKSVIVAPSTVWNKNGNLFYKGKWAEKLEEGKHVTDELTDPVAKGEDILQDPKRTESMKDSMISWKLNNK